MTAAAPNVYERSARERKASRLADTAEVHYRAIGVTDLGLVADCLEQLTDAGWRSLAVAGGCKPPSDVTKRRVIERIRQRAEWDQVDPFARYGGGS